MLSRFRARTGIFGLARTPIRLSAQNAQSQIRIQHVNLKEKKTPSFRRSAINVTGILITYYLWQYCAVVAIPEGLPDATTEEKEEMDKNPFFIPFLGTTRPLPLKPYKGTDPQWQEFVKFSKNAQLQNQIREDLANIVSNAVARYPFVKIQLQGDAKLKIRKHWLDIDYPRAPHRQFERSGIVITDDYIAYGSKTVDQKTVSQIQRVVWPVQNLAAFYSFFQVIAAKAINDTLVAVGLKTPRGEQPTIEDLLAKRYQAMMIKKLPDGHPKSDATVKDPLSMSKTQDLGQADQTTIEKREGPWPLAGSSSKETQETLSSHFQQSIHAFKAKWRKGLSTKNLPLPPEGSVIVHGLVEIDAPATWIVLDVKAHWDPKTREYDLGSMQVLMRRFSPKTQSAMG